MQSSIFLLSKPLNLKISIHSVICKARKGSSSNFNVPYCHSVCLFKMKIGIIRETPNCSAACHRERVFALVQGRAHHTPALINSNSPPRIGLITATPPSSLSLHITYLLANAREMPARTLAISQTVLNRYLHFNSGSSGRKRSGRKRSARMLGAGGGGA
jgi:hypothetical protein